MYFQVQVKLKNGETFKSARYNNALAEEAGTPVEEACKQFEEMAEMVGNLEYFSIKDDSGVQHYFAGNEITRISIYKSGF